MDVERILIATDLSPESCVSYRHGRALALAFGAEVTLLHVDETADMYVGLVKEAALESYREGLAEACCEQLERQAAALSLPEGSVSTRLEHGSPWRKILSVAEETGADLIVLTKPHGPEPPILGSTTKRVVRRASTPVLIADHTGYASGPETVSYGRVIYPTDFSKHARRGLPVAAAIARRLGADLVLTHVLPVPVPLPHLGRRPPDWSADHLEQDFRRRATERLEALAEQIDKENATPIETVLLEGMNVAAALARAADRQTDLMVIPSHGRGAVDAILLGSTAERLLHATARPVLVLRRAYLDRQGSSKTPE